MRIKRAIIPIIVALGAAGAILAGSAVPAATAQAPRAHTVVAGSPASHNMYYHW
jgi:hypothetical protein